MSVLNLDLNPTAINTAAFSPQESSHFGSREIIVDYDLSLVAALEAKDAAVLKSYIGRVINFIQNETISIQKIRVYFEEDTEPRGEIVCSVYVNAPADEAMSFWQRVEADTSCWLDTQDLETKGFAIDHIITVVRW